MDVGIVVKALQEIGCESVCMAAYGFKSPIDVYGSSHAEPATIACTQHI